MDLLTASSNSGAWREMKGEVEEERKKRF